MKIKLIDYNIGFADECTELLKRYDRNPQNRFSDFMKNSMLSGRNYLVLFEDKIIAVLDNLYSPKENSLSADIYFSKNSINNSNVGKFLGEVKKLGPIKNSNELKLIIKQEDKTLLTKDQNQFLTDCQRATTDAAVRVRRSNYILKLMSE